jgi:hypothetical protein
MALARKTKEGRGRRQKIERAGETGKQPRTFTRVFPRRDQVSSTESRLFGSALCLQVRNVFEKIQEGIVLILIFLFDLCEGIEPKEMSVIVKEEM